MFTHVIQDGGREVGNRHQHATVEEARDCEDQYAECRAEQEAESGYERWLEDAGSRRDPAGYEHDRLLEAQEAMYR